MKLFEPKVQLEPISHKYYNKEGVEYMSVSKLLGSLSEKFESKPAYKRASAETKKAWEENRDAAADHGTRIHNALELYKANATVLPENEDLREMIVDICKHYKDYYQVHDELCVYNDECLLAGTSDMICIVKKSSNGWFDVEDYKTNRNKGIETFSKYGDTLFPPFNYLQDCNFVKYSLQLSIYAYMFELLTGMKCRKLGIRYIPAHDYMQHEYIPTMYMKPEVEHIFRERKKQLANGQ